MPRTGGLEQSPEQHIIGVDVGGSKILARVVDPKSGRAEGRIKSQTPTTGPPAVVDTIVAAIEGLENWRSAAAVGVGMPGPVTPGGVAGPCPNIKGWDDAINLAAGLESQIDLPVVVNNDVNCGAVAEHRLGAGQGQADMLAIFVGTGVGGGLVLNNRLVSGQRGMAGEIGHVTVEPGGRPCGCGGRGHLEAYAGRAGLDNEMRRRSGDGANRFLLSLVGTAPLKSRHLAAGVEAVDPLSLALIDEAANALARVIGNSAALLDLPHVVLGGGIVDRLGEPFLDQIRDSPDFGGFGPSITDVVLAHRLDDAGAVGAALLASDHFRDAHGDGGKDIAASNRDL